MPKRGESTSATPRRRGGVEREEKVTKQEVAEKTEEKKIIKKNPLEAKVKKFLTDVVPDIADKVDEIVIRNVKDEEGNKNDCAYVTFTAGSDDDVENEVENVLCIKDLLLAYHTTDQSKLVKGKPLYIEVIAPEDAETPYITVFQEYVTE